MTQVSRHKLEPEDEERTISLFIDELAKITDPKELKGLLDLLLVPTEKLMLAKRMAVFVMVEHNLPDAHIAKSLHLTRVTVQKLRLTYQLAKEKDDPVVKIVQKPELKKLLMPILKKILVDYALPAAFGKIPRRPIL